MENQENLDALIIDGYVDEPSLLGVPPFISTVPRLIAGVLEEKNFNWEYMTADEYRNKKLPKAKYILVHGGVTVPGNYLGGTPLKSDEAEKISVKNSETFIGGPLAKYEDIKGFDHYVTQDLSAYVFEYLNGKPEDRSSTLEERERWFLKGAKVVKKHPFYPDPLIAEISMYRGCPRYFKGGCLFCSEPEYGKPKFRDQNNIIEEIKELYENGIRNFRVGGQTCTISYKAKGIGTKEVPNPQPKEIEKLFKGIRKNCPNLNVLHLDNANPAVIANYPKKSKEILRTLVKYTTPGNILALGMESADTKVIKKNNLNSNPDEVKKAIKIINEIGRDRGENGMPNLLPGINFLGGLRGETSETYKRNLEFLNDIKENDLWLRRINIRKVLEHQKKFNLEYEKEFKNFKKNVRENIDQPMLEKILPVGTVLKDIYMVKRDGNKTFGRQIGTYPLLVGVNYPLKLGEYFDIAITDYGYRSITGIRYPIDPSNSSFKEINSIPRIGKKKAGKIFRKKPKNKEELSQILDKENYEDVIQFLEFKDTNYRG